MDIKYYSPFGIRSHKMYNKHSPVQYNSRKKQKDLENNFTPTYFENQRKGYIKYTDYHRNNSKFFSNIESINLMKYGPKVNIQPDRLLELINKPFRIKTKEPILDDLGNVVRDDNGNIYYNDKIGYYTIRKTLVDAKNVLDKIQKNLERSRFDDDDVKSQIHPIKKRLDELSIASSNEYIRKKLQNINIGLSGISERMKSG